MIPDSLTVGLIATAALFILPIATFLLVARVKSPRWRHPWWAALGAIVMTLATASLVDSALVAPREMRALETQVGLPATFTTDSSTLTLRRDGTAELTNVVLADEVTRDESGRFCLSGEGVALTGEARWAMSAEGGVRLERDGRVSLLFADPRPILGYGWTVTYLIFPCATPFSTEYTWRSPR